MTDVTIYKVWKYCKQHFIQLNSEYFKWWWIIWQHKPHWQKYVSLINGFSCIIFKINHLWFFVPVCSRHAVVCMGKNFECFFCNNYLVLNTFELFDFKISMENINKSNRQSVVIEQMQISCQKVNTVGESSLCLAKIKSPVYLDNFSLLVALIGAFRVKLENTWTHNAPCSQIDNCLSCTFESVQPM